MTGPRWVPVGEPVKYLKLDISGPFQAYFTTRRIRNPSALPGVGEVSWLIQVHGNRVLSPDEPIYGTLPGDAQVTAHTGFSIGVRVADCFPIYIIEPDVPCIGLIHAGWRSSEKRITERTVKKMVELFGAEPQKMFAAFGPGICPEHYEVGDEFRGRFGEHVGEREGKLYLDLEGFNTSVLLELGIPEENIVPSPYCTYERADLFFSYRRDGKILGEMWAILGMV